MLTLKFSWVVLGGESQERMLCLEKVSRPPLLLGMLADSYDIGGDRSWMM